MGCIQSSDGIDSGSTHHSKRRSERRRRGRSRRSRRQESTHKPTVSDEGGGVHEDPTSAPTVLIHAPASSSDAGTAKPNAGKSTTASNQSHPSVHGNRGTPPAVADDDDANDEDNALDVPQMSSIDRRASNPLAVPPSLRRGSADESFGRARSVPINLPLSTHQAMFSSGSPASSSPRKASAVTISGDAADHHLSRSSGGIGTSTNNTLTDDTGPREVTARSRTSLALGREGGIRDPLSASAGGALALPPRSSSLSRRPSSKLSRGTRTTTLLGSASRASSLAIASTTRSGSLATTANTSAASPMLMSTAGALPALTAPARPLSVEKLAMIDEWLEEVLDEYIQRGHLFLAPTHGYDADVGAGRTDDSL